MVGTGYYRDAPNNESVGTGWSHAQMRTSRFCRQRQRPWRASAQHSGVCWAAVREGSQPLQLDDCSGGGGWPAGLLEREEAGRPARPSMRCACGPGHARVATTLICSSSRDQSRVNALHSLPPSSQHSIQPAGRFARAWCKIAFSARVPPPYLGRPPTPTLWSHGAAAESQCTDLPPPTRGDLSWTSLRTHAACSDPYQHPTNTDMRHSAPSPAMQAGSHHLLIVTGPHS